MILTELPDGDSVFIDANIFIYHFGGRSPECKAFLERCARRELLGYTATPVLAEVLHRLMVAEAIMKGLVTAKTAVRKLGETPALVKQLTQYQEDVSKISQKRRLMANEARHRIAARVQGKSEKSRCGLAT